MKEHVHLLTTTVARVLFAVPFLVFGVMHIMAGKQMAGFVPATFPGDGTFWVYLTGIVFIVASLGLLFKKHTEKSSYLLAILLLVFVLSIWLPQLGGENPLAISSLLKDTALLGAALTFAGLNFAKREAK